MIRLSLPKGSNAGFRASLKRSRRVTKREEDKIFKPPDLDQDKHQDNNSSLLIKEAPPDANFKSKTKPRIPDHFKKIIDNKNDLQDKLDLRSNPFQVGEDDVILPSTKDFKHEEGLEPEELLEPELNGVKHGALEELVAVETKEQEGALHITLGPTTRTKARQLNQASLHQLLHTIQGKLECSYPTTLAVIQVTQVFIKRGVWIVLFFPPLGFVPMGFPREVFNEASPYTLYPSLLMKTQAQSP